MDYHATEGRSWRLHLSADGARPAPAAPADAPADATARGTAHDLVMLFYGRDPLDSPELTGDRSVFDQLIAWDPTA